MVFPPQYCLNLSSKCGKGFTHLILLCSTYTVLSVGTFIAHPPALSQATKTHSPTYQYGFKRTVAYHTLNSGLTEQTLYPIW